MKTRPSNHLRTVLDAAVADERACFALLRDPFIDTVRPELKAELQRALETLRPPIHPALSAWNAKATAWIRDELAWCSEASAGKPRAAGTDSGASPITTVAVLPVAPLAMPLTAPLATRPIEPSAMPPFVVYDAASLDTTLEYLRLLATAHFASADERSLTIDVQFMESAVELT